MAFETMYQWQWLALCQETEAARLLCCVQRFICFVRRSVLLTSRVASPGFMDKFWCEAGEMATYAAALM